MNIVPVGYRDRPIRHFVLTGATLGSTSYAAPATGFAYVPIGAWVSGSAAASVTYYNGTAGSALFTLKTTLAGVTWIDFWEEPSRLAQTKCAVLESNTGIGIHDFHVFAIVARAGAGAGGTEQ